MATNAKLEWTEAPTKTQWGVCMRRATIELDKNHVLDLYVEEDAIHLVLGALAKLLGKQA